MPRAAPCCSWPPLSGRSSTAICSPSRPAHACSPHEALEEAADSGFVARVDAGAYRFTHAVIRETLYEDLTRERRASLHARIGAALEEHAPHRQGILAAALAHHFFHGLPEADAGRALHYARRAGEQALELCAYEDAASYFVRALDLLDRGGAAAPAERAELLLALAGATVRSDDTAAATEAAAAAAAEARGLGSAALLAEPL